MDKKFDLKYAGSAIGFFGMFASMFSFVSVFLLHKGYDNSTIGSVLAVSGILSILLQTGQANFLDKNPRFRIQDTISMNIIIVLIGSVLLFFTGTNMFLLGLIVFIFAFTQSSETLLNSMAFVFDRFGVKINYGFGRGMGSLAFAIMTIIVGNVVEATSPNYIPVFYIVMGSIVLLFIRSFRHPLEHKTTDEENETAEQFEASDQSLLDFFKRYKRLIIVMIGVVFVLFTHTVVNNFFIQIITPIGGNSATMGTAIFLGAVVELPAMFNYDRIERHIPAKHLLKITTIFFLVKHLLTYFAPNMTVIYIAQVVQIGAFALIYPTCVSYIRSVVSKKDAIRGQSLFTSAMAVSSVVGSYFGGILLDDFGVSTTLMFGIIANIIGVIIIVIATEDKKVK